MSEEITWVQGDRPTETLQIEQRWDEHAYDVTGSGMVVTAKFRAQGETDASLWDVECSKVYPEWGIVQLEVPADGLDADDVPAGRYELEITCTLNGKPLTCVNMIKVRVLEEFPDA